MALLYAGVANGMVSAMFLARRGMDCIGKVCMLRVCARASTNEY
jgi:hypothetical protein